MAALIVLDLDQPWEMINSLNRWLQVLQEVAHSMIGALPLSTQDQIRQRVVEHIKNYEIDGT